ncbi:MAG: hypothetical protein IJO56_07420 [Oscillospiraceae bacterium]|nr:hypothetical protein [Oscillospiraceae bacterium]
MKKYIFPAIAVILILIYMITILPAPNPKRCAICDSIPYHAPALVNLATGEVGELAVYDPHPFKVAELNDYQQGGTFSFIYAAGLNGYSDTANWETHITIPINENEYEEKFFCKSCRTLISSHTENGFLLLDLREPEKFSILSLGSDEIQRLRCYEIQTTQQSNEVEIEIHGTLEIVNHFIQ